MMVARILMVAAALAIIYSVALTVAIHQGEDTIQMSEKKKSGSTIALVVVLALVVVAVLAWVGVIDGSSLTSFSK